MIEVSVVAAAILLQALRQVSVAARSFRRNAVALHSIAVAQMGAIDMRAPVASPKAFGGGFFIRPVRYLPFVPLCRR